MPLFEQSQLRSVNNIIRTKSLFLETSYDDGSEAIMTLKESDWTTKEGKRLLSLRRLFVEYTLDDPSEYEFAMEVFGSWEVWLKVRSANKPTIAAVEKAREEADIKRKSLAFRTVIHSVKEGNATFQAQKWLVDEPWKTKPTTKDGRKDRAEQAVRAEEAFVKEGFDSDLERLKEEGLIN